MGTYSSESVGGKYSLDGGFIRSECGNLVLSTGERKCYFRPSNYVAV